MQLVCVRSGFTNSGTRPHTADTMAAVPARLSLGPVTSRHSVLSQSRASLVLLGKSSDSALWKATRKIRVKNSVFTRLFSKHKQARL